MRIVLLPAPEGNVIGREEQFGRDEGEFIAAPDGRVLYRHPWDSRLWFAGPTVAAFHEAVAAWNRYGDQVQACDTDEGEQAVVRQLGEAFSRSGVLDARENNLWLLLLEQAQDGLL